MRQGNRRTGQEIDLGDGVQSHWQPLRTIWGSQKNPCMQVFFFIPWTVVLFSDFDFRVAFLSTAACPSPLFFCQQNGAI